MTICYVSGKVLSEICCFGLFPPPALLFSTQHSQIVIIPGLDTFVGSSVSKLHQAVMGWEFFSSNLLLPLSNSLSNSVCGNFMTQPLRWKKKSGGWFLGWLLIMIVYPTTLFSPHDGNKIDNGFISCLLPGFAYETYTQNFPNNFFLLFLSKMNLLLMLFWKWCELALTKTVIHHFSLLQLLLLPFFSYEGCPKNKNHEFWHIEKIKKMNAFHI